MVRNLYWCCTVPSGHTFPRAIPFSFPQGPCQPCHHISWMPSRGGLAAVARLLSILFSCLRKTRLSALHKNQIWLDSSFPRNKSLLLYLVYRELYSANKPVFLFLFLSPTCLPPFTPSFLRVHVWAALAAPPANPAVSSQLRLYRNKLPHNYCMVSVYEAKLWQTTLNRDP